MNKYQWLILLLIPVGIICTVRYLSSLQSQDIGIEKEINTREISADSEEFISQIQEPWNFFSKEVYRDFHDYNALQSSDFDSDTVFTSQVIRIYGRDDLSKVLLQLDHYKYLEALSFVECRFNSTQFQELIELLKTKEYFRKLMISYSNISTIPSSISQLKNLETLGLDHNKLTEINDEIAYFPNLKYLSLRGNKSLAKLTKKIGFLSELELLDISASAIDSIPNSIGQCLKLKALTANGGKLEYVPRSIGKCQELISLNLGYNQISYLPSEIGTLENLGILSVGHNPYDSIPVSYRNLDKLFSFN